MERFTRFQRCLRILAGNPWKLRVIHAPPHATIACAMRTLMGVKNIEFSVLHVALSKLVRHREGEIYCEVRVVRERRSPGVEGA